MPKSFELFRRKLESLLQNRGAKSEFCRKTGIGRSVLDRWLSGESAPTLDTLDRIEDGLGSPIWQLICPDEDLANSVGKDRHLRALAEMTLKIKELEAQLNSVRAVALEQIIEAKRGSKPAQDQSEKQNLADRIAALPDQARSELTDILEDLIKGYEAEIGQSKEAKSS